MPYIPKRSPLSPCPVELALGQVAGKWKVRIIDLLRNRPCRFAELRRSLSGVSQQVLACQLQALQSDGLISSRVIVHRGQELKQYALTQQSDSLITALDALADYGNCQLSER